MAEYLQPEVVDAIETAIIKNFEEIAFLATNGTPPITALVADLSNLINEASYWRLADRCIGYALGSSFERAGREDVDIPLLRRAAVYVTPPT